MSDSLKRSHSCGLLTKEAAGEQVVLCGWVAKRRDHGGLIFVDLRDRSGIVQIVVDPDDAGNSFTTAEAIRSEYVIKVAMQLPLIRILLPARSKWLPLIWKYSMLPKLRRFIFRTISIRMRTCA
jgi:hypothetical protein